MKPFEKGKRLLQIFSNLGHESYFVGGALRDYLLKREISDIDIATPLLPEEVMNLFPKTVPIGLKHGTVLVLFDGEPFEVTTFRTEGGYTDFRHPDSVRFVKNIAEDLSRRDFTMNAMAMNLHGELLDPFGGEADILKKQIRAVGDANTRFTEDPLRILRAFRFCSQLGFQLEEETRKAAYQKMEGLQHISVERIQVEMDKLLDGSYVQAVWRLLDESNITAFIPLGKTAYKWSELVSYDFVQLETIEEKWAFLYFIANIENSEQQLTVWKFSNKRKNEIVTLLKWLKRKGKEPLTAFEVYLLGLQQAKQLVNIQAIWLQRSKKDEVAELQKIWDELPIHSRQDIPCDGKAILEYTGEKRGPWVGELLQDLEKAIIQGTCQNDEKQIERWVLNWLQEFKKKC